jgi:hypothetical protein
MMKCLSIFFILIIPFLIFGDFDIHFEGGAVFCGYNDIKIPKNSGTEYSFCDDLDYNTAFYGRLHLGYKHKSKHYAFITISPLTLKAEGTLDKDLNYNGIIFYAGEKLISYYNFNSWRITYRYTLIKNDKLHFAAGLTAKIRDAYISVESPDKKEKFSNIGFVPIIHFSLDYKLNDLCGINLTGDALGSPYGRAEDVRFSFYYSITDKMKFDLGYRILEGGADVDDIEGFALFHYASLGFSYQL